jgi:transcriptional regulator with XRE-family HTH domain
MVDDDFDDDGPDFLDELTAKSIALDPEFPKLMEEARRQRELRLALRTTRRRSRVSRRDVATAMGTTQSAVSELETNAVVDARISTIVKYADAIGYSVQFHFVPADQAVEQPSVVVHPRS